MKNDITKSTFRLFVDAFAPCFKFFATLVFGNCGLIDSYVPSLGKAKVDQTPRARKSAAY